jgi:hypothetical protein
MKKVLNVVLAAAAVAVMAVPAMAAPKLVVKDNQATPSSVFSVDETGSVVVGSTATPVSKLDVVQPQLPQTGLLPIAQLYAGTTLRSKTNNNGIQYWYLQDGSTNLVDSGTIAYATPGGKVGITMSIGGGPTYTNRWNIVNWGTYFSIYPQSNYTLPAFNITDNVDPNVGISVIAPTAKLEVNGGVRLNTATARPTCTATIRGTLWVTQGTTDTLAICATTGTGLGWKAITLP